MSQLATEEELIIYQILFEQQYGEELKYEDIKFMSRLSVKKKISQLMKELFGSTVFTYRHNGRWVAKQVKVISTDGRQTHTYGYGDTQASALKSLRENLKICAEMEENL
jgi:hypothetical protein